MFSKCTDGQEVKAVNQAKVKQELDKNKEMKRGSPTHVRSNQDTEKYKLTRE